MLQVNYQFFPHLGHFIHIPFRSMFLFRFPALPEAKQKSSISIDWTTKIQKHEYKDEFSRPTFTALAPSLSPSVVCLLIVLAFIRCLWGSDSPRMRIKLHGEWKKFKNWCESDTWKDNSISVLILPSGLDLVSGRMWMMGLTWWFMICMDIFRAGPGFEIALQGKIFTTFPWLLLQCHALSCQPTI